MGKNTEIVLGIDFGTSYSSAAALICGNVEWVLDRGDSTIPSTVHFPRQGAPIVGMAAHAQLAISPATTVQSIKRILGKRMDDREVRLLDAGVGYRMEAGPNQLVTLKIGRQRYACEQIVGAIISYLREIAEKRFGTRIQKAVVAVPAEADPSFISALRRATKIAHLQLLQVIPEPIAGALSLGVHGTACNRRIAVCDFGGGTFDATLVEQRGLQFTPIACRGNSNLGGDDFDVIMSNEIAAAVHRRSGYSMQKDIVRWQQLKMRCESVKRILSRQQEARVVMTDAYIENGKYQNIDVLINREWVDSRWEPLIKKMQGVLARLLKTSGMHPENIDDVVLIGGTSLIPCVQRGITEFFERDSIHMNEFANVAVAYGATLQTAGHMEVSTQLPALTISNTSQAI